MTYRLSLSDPAHFDIESTVEYIHQSSPQNAASWLQGIEKTILSLEEMPDRCTRSSHSKRLGRDIRYLVYERHLIFFMIDEKIQEVTIIRVWPGAKDGPRKVDLENGIRSSSASQS
jgi:plasmid stabilization system protein ParE